jgi:cytochrome c peroxidase
MASPEPRVSEQLKATPRYRDFFSKAFPGDRDPVTLENVQKAIAVFEATLITPDAPFDRFLKGETNALSSTALRLFMDKGCANCHNGINIGGGMYAPFGVVEQPGADILPPNDKGRFTVTKTANDECLQGADPSEHCSDGAVFSQRSGLGSASGGCSYGGKSARHPTQRRGGRQDHGFPGKFDRGAA